MPKLCKKCGSQLVKIRNESEKRYQAKQFCSAICARIYLKKNRLGWWSMKDAPLEEVLKNE